ncbi:MAG: hypothetical protein BWX75_01131 [Candidatus Cloacimonetes bacterium ADurb.Bin088]|nr:MAG: hypothetical protein BWX75_01131 [Candidatus Cloacimonetes bacterium ADurb.Bin088]
MKKLLLIAIVLSLAVFASAYTVRSINQQIMLETLDIMTYVTAPAGTHDANWRLDVTDGIDVVSTTTHMTQLIRVETKSGPTGLAAWAYVDMQAFTTVGPSTNVEITWTLTYLPNTDEATNNYVFSIVLPSGGAVWRATHNGLHLILPDSLILGSVPPPPTYTVNMSTNPEGYITPTTLGPTEDVTTIYGTYTPTPLPAPATGYWTPASLTIDENTQWTADGDNFVLNQEFVWTETYPTIYNLYVRGELGYAVTGPVSGTIEYDASNADVTALVGDYTVAAAPEGYHWEVNPISVVATDFVEEQPGAKSVRAQRIFNHTITFVLVEDTPPPAYTITITAADAETNEPLVANIYIDGVDSGYLTPYTFTEGVDYTPGVYTVVLDGYTDWIPESVTFPAVLTHDYTTNFIGTREQVTPVELSSFSATLTANLFVKLTWVSQTETNMVGYKVYRGTSANIADAEMLDIPMVPATNTSSSATYTVTDSNVLENNTYYYWLETIDYHETQFFGPTSVFVDVTPPVTNQTKIVKSGPNPFKIGDTYNIQLDVKTGETGTVTIYNVIGQVVRTYSVTGGSNQLVKWDGKDSRGNTCGSGIYFYKLSTPSVNQSKKIVVVK